MCVDSGRKVFLDLMETAGIPGRLPPAALTPPPPRVPWSQGGAGRGKDRASMCPLYFSSLLGNPSSFVRVTVLKQKRLRLLYTF